MTPLEAKQAVADRFRRWGDFLVSENAAPLIVIAVNHADHRLVVTSCEDVSNDLIADACEQVARSLRAGSVTYV